MDVLVENSSATLGEALDRTVAAIGGRAVTLREIIAYVGEQGLLMWCALLTLPFLLPVSIPGVSTVFGLAIILLSVGITLKRAPWLPKRILDRPIDAEKLVPALKKGREIVAKVERVIRPRIAALTGAAMVRFNGLALIAGGALLMFPLGLVPFSNTLPAFGILFLSVGMSQRDGLFVLAGYGMLAATLAYFGVLAYLVLIAGRGLAALYG